MKKRKVLIIIAISIVAVFVMALLAVRIYYFHFYTTAKKEFKVPALHDNFIPQGLEYCEEDKVFLVSGYLYKSGEARICVVNPDGSYHMTVLQDEAGINLISHSGGISMNGDYIYLAGGRGKCFVLSSKEIIKENKAKVKVLGRFPSRNNASFCFVKNDSLYIGEYHHDIKYSTDESHHFTTPGSDSNKALIFEYPLDGKMEFGVSPIPSAAYSITDRIQGMCITNDGTMILSASSVFQGSQLYLYDLGSAMEGIRPDDSFTINDITVPLYYLDRDRLLKTMEILPKSEEVAICNNRLFMLFESASRRFQYGKLIGGQYVYSLPLAEIAGADME